MAKSTKIIAALGVVAGLGVAAMPLATFAAPAAQDSLTDVITINVAETCEFQDETARTEGTYNGIAGKDAVGTATAGTMISFTSNGTHTVSVKCNNTGGYNVSAKASDLRSNGESSTTTQTIPYVVDDITAVPEDATKSQGKWTAQITNGNNSTGAVTAIPAGTTGGIVKYATGSTGDTAQSFTVNYKGYVGFDNEAGSYIGTVVYTLSSPAA